MSSSQGVNRRLLTRDVKAAHPVGKVGSERVQVYSQDGKLYAQLSSNDAVLIADLSVGSVPVGSVSAYAGNDTEPAGYFLCDGSEKSQTDYAALYAVIGDDYGSASSGNFKLPDLAGKVIASVDGSNALASAAGAESVSLVAANLPSHTHTVDTGNLTTTVNNGDNGPPWARNCEPDTHATSKYKWLNASTTCSTMTQDLLREASSAKDWDDHFTVSIGGSASVNSQYGNGSGGVDGVNVRQPTLYMKYIIKY